jgi:molybdate transport system substrate-binding protein
MRLACIIALSGLAFASPAGSARAADIKVLSTRAVMTILETVGPEFERATGHKLDVSSDIAINHVRRVMAGEPFDLPRLARWTI